MIRGVTALRRVRRNRWGSAGTLSLVLTLVLTLLTAGPATARPDSPSEDEIERSRETVRERADAVASVEARLSDARARMDTLSARVQRLVEKYYQQQVDLERARQRYADAKERLRGAQQGAERARDRVADLAAQRYRSGGGLRHLGTVLGSDGPQELIDRMNSLQILSRERAARLDKMHATEIVAGVLRKQAEKAFAEQQAATRRVEEAKRAAQEAVAQQRAEVERIRALEAQLEEKLNNAQARTSRLEQQREEYLQWRRERREAREAARQAAREEARAAREAAQEATEEVAEVIGVSDCADKPVSLGGYANGLIPPQALCPLPQAGHMLRADAAAAFERLNAAYTEAFGAPICVTDSYRSLAVQQRLYQVKPELAAIPGTSNHGWGVAVDLCGGINSYSTATHEWMRANAPAYGWILPSWARATGSMPEPWHWEYTG